MYQWQRQLLQNIHVHAMLYGHSSQGAYHDAITKTIDSLPRRLNALKVLHISVWRDLVDIMDNFLSKEWMVAMSIFRLADLQNQYPTLQEVIIGFGTPTEHMEVLNEMIEEVASGNYNVADGQQLLVDLPSVQTQIGS